MTAFHARAAIDRGARHVGRFRLRTPDRRKQPHVQMLVEESLRLTSLPGEDQGRFYCIRRLTLPTLDGQCTPSEWTARCGQRLIAAAHLASRASEPGAGAADVVFFDDVQQPFRLLVTRLLRAEPASEWFWRQATRVAADQSSAERLELVLERWHAQPARWSGVARELLPALDLPGARALMGMLRPSTAARWLPPSLQTAATASQAEAVPPLRQKSRRLLHDVRRQFGAADPRVLFLALLAVLEASPASTPTVDVLAIAVDAANGDAIPNGDAAAPLGLPVDRRSPSAAPARAAAPSTDTTPAAASRSRPERSATSPRAPDVPPLEDSVAGDETGCAGLYFLLHVLEHLGVDAALDAHPELTVTHFVTRVLLRSAARAGVDPDDPVLRPLLDDLADLPPQTSPDPIVMPRALEHLRRLRSSSDTSERLWACAVQRWCRRIARVGVSEVVKRPGRIHQTRVSIDVRLPMSAVDVRIRRAGLDIDPGYVPWFGRVVHFHYDEGDV